MDDQIADARSPVQPARRRRFRKPLRALLRQIHLWTGLVLCIPLVAIGVSGSYLTYHDEIDQLLGDRVAFVATSGPARPISEIVAAALAAASPGSVATQISLPTADRDPATVRVGPMDAGFRDPRVSSVVVDPVSLAVLGTEAGGLRGLTRLMHDIHGHVLLSGGIGRAVVGWLGVAMLALGVTGLVLWWPKPGRIAASLKVKRGAKGYRLHRDLHGALGFWSLVVFVLVSFSGVYIAFPSALSAAVGWLTGNPPRQESEARVEPLGDVAPLGLDDMAGMARRAVPAARLRSVSMPFRPGQPARAVLDLPDAAEGAPPAMVMIDPWRRLVVGVRDPRRYTAREAVDAWQRPLHEGAGLGPAWRFLVFLSGLLPVVFAVTGVVMWTLRGRRAGSRR